MAKKKRRVSRRSFRLTEALLRVRVWLLAFFLFSMPLFFLPMNTEYGYTKSVYTLLFVSLLMVLWAMEALLRKGAEVHLSWLFPILPAFLITSLLSLLGGAEAGGVIQSATLFLYFGFIYLLVLNAGQGERQVMALLGALLCSAVASAMWGLLQYVGLALGGPGTGLSAMIATMGNRQFLAGFLSYLILPSGILCLRLRSVWARAVALGGAGFAFAVMLLTRQVGVRLGLGIAVAVIAFASGLWPVLWGRWLGWAVAGGVALAGMVAVLGPIGFLYVLGLAMLALGLWALGRLLRARPWSWVPTALAAVAAVLMLIPVTTPFSGVRDLWARQSGAVRAYDWWVGYEMWQDSPIVGIGLGAYKIQFVPYKAHFLDTPRGEAYDFHISPAAQAHNEYVQVAAEMGTLGFLVLIAGLGLIVVLGLRRVAAMEDRGRRLELLLLGGGIVVTLVHAAVTFPWRLPASSMAFVAILALAFSPRYGQRGRLSLVLRGRPLMVVCVLVFLLASVVSVFAVRDLVADQHLRQAQIALARGDAPRARAHLERSVELDFFPRLSLYYLGIAQLRIGEIDAARDTLRQCLTRHVNATLYLNLASAHLQLEELDEARDILMRLLAARPRRDQEAAGRYLLAETKLLEADRHTRGGMRAEALEALREAEAGFRSVLEVDPRNERAYIRLGDIARQEQRYDEAREHYERAQQLIDAALLRAQRDLERAQSLDDHRSAREQLEFLRQAEEVVQRMLARLP